MDDEHCAVCELEITGRSVGPVKELQGKHFHQDCFVCAKCGKELPYNLADHPLVLHEGKIYHEHCTHHLNLRARETPTELPCSACSHLIKAGDVDVEAHGKHYHNKCFVCAKCNERLQGDFVSRAGGYYHINCK